MVQVGTNISGHGLDPHFLMLTCSVSC